MIHTNLTTHGAGMETSATTPQCLLRAVLTALNQGKISHALDQFDDHFSFSDRALGLEFANKEGLREFFTKSRELFPDTALEINCIYESGDSAFAEWNLTATRAGHYCSVPLRFPISLSGASIVRIDSGRIRYWSDYYDEKSSMRLTLASFFVKAIDY
jgi:hypothetical protein